MSQLQLTNKKAEPKILNLYPDLARLGSMALVGLVQARAEFVAQSRQRVVCRGSQDDDAQLSFG